MIAAIRSAMTPSGSANAGRDVLPRLRRLYGHQAGGLRGMSLQRLTWTLLVVGLFSLWSTSRTFTPN